MPEWTIQKLLNWITQYFTDNNIDAPRLSAEMLLSFILKLARIELYTNFDKVIDEFDLDRLHGLVKRCVDNEPIQYLIGSTEFYSLSLNVSADCLIPRPETELLVERAIEFLRTRSGPQYICDLCTGSGCIAVAIAKNFENARIIATDICDKALAVAAMNVEKYNLRDRIELLNGDLFAPVIAQLDVSEFDLIVTNPPYVSSSEYEALAENVKNYEPKHALYAGADGLDIYRRIISEIDKHLKPGGAFIAEIGYAQGPAVKELLEETDVFTDIKIEKDFNRNDRVVTATKKSL